MRERGRLYPAAAFFCKVGSNKTETGEGETECRAS